MSGVALAVRTALALGAVLALAWGMARLGGRARRGRNSAARLDIVASRGVARGASVSVVRVGERVLVVGTTPQAMGLLAELTPEEARDWASVPTTDGPADRRPGNHDPATRTLRRLPGGWTPPDLIGATGSTSARMTDLVERLRERTVRRA